MRKNVFGRQFGRDSGERKALFKGLASSLVLEERIQTTEEKAKAVRGQIEKLVTKAKKGDENAARLVGPYLNAEALSKMMNDVAPRFKSRPGGYTRIIRMGNRLQDNASMVILEWVEKRAPVDRTAEKKAKKATKKAAPKKVVKKAAPKKTVKKEAKK